MTKKENKGKTTVDLGEKLHKKLKLYCAKNDMKIKDAIAKGITLLIKGE